MTKGESQKPPAELDAIADAVLAYKPKPKSKPAKKRKKLAKKLASRAKSPFELQKPG